MSASFDQNKINALAAELDEPQQLAGGGAIRKAARAIGQEALPGAPTTANVPNIGEVQLGKNPEAEAAARRSASASGVPYKPTTRYAPVDVNRAKRIAREYELMKHAPDDPLVRMAYEQMIKESMDQYDAMLQAGVEPYFIDPNVNPYPNSPYEALLDITENRRLGVFPSVEGFGTDPNFNPDGNPLLQDTGRMISGRPALANDIFRAVHDYYGHAKPGVGFRAAGEENAYQSHAGMFSPLARRALASETRGQNSWLNYGPFGDTNRTAKIEDTIFADQKAGLMPRWASEEGLVINDDRRREFFDNLARNRTGLEGAISDDGKLRLVHYSSRPLERIDPEFYGRGLSRGSIAERNRSYDPEFVKRSYYGIPASENPYVPEFGLGGVRNEVLIEPELIYQAQANPEGLWLPNDPTGSERRIAESGYTGYYTTHPKLGKVAVIFDPYDVTKTYMVPVGAVGAGAMALSGEDEPETMARGGLVDKLRSAASSVGEAGDVYKSAVANMFSPFEPVDESTGDPSDYEFPELRLRRPGIVNLALGMPNLPADLRSLYGAAKDYLTGDQTPDEEWRRFDAATRAQDLYEQDMDNWLQNYTGKSVDELSAPMAAVLGVSEALSQPGVIPAKLVAGLPRAARYLSNLAEFATPVTVASPAAMLTGATVNAGLRSLPALLADDDLPALDDKYSRLEKREIPEEERAMLKEKVRQAIGKKEGGVIDRLNQAFYENVSKPAVGTAIDMTLGLGDLAQMGVKYLGDRFGMDSGEFTSVAQPVKEALGIDSYNPYTLGGVGASVLPFAAMGRGTQALAGTPAAIRQIQATLPNLGRESAAYAGAEAAAAGARELMPESTVAELLAIVAGGMGGSALGSQPTSMGIIKEKGGNWIGGSIEDELATLHSANQGMYADSPAVQLAEIEKLYTPERMSSLTIEQAEELDRQMSNLRARASIDDWIDTKLNRYIRNEMATESDPIRLHADSFEGIRAERLAQKDEQIARAIDNMERARLERGRTPEEMTRSQEQIRQLQRERALIAAQTGLHADPDIIGVNRHVAPKARLMAGYPEYGVGQSYAGKAWENSADASIRGDKAGDLLTEGESEWVTPEALSRMHNDFIEKNPWIAKIPPESNVYSWRRSNSNVSGLGFGHMMDELRNATRVDSDLPENLRIDPNYLSKMSVPQIVQRIDEINALREVQRTEADALKAFNAATIPYRDYDTIPYSDQPNVEGLRWVQISVPQTLPEGYRVDPGDVGYYRIVDDKGNRSTYGAETEEEAIRMFNQSRENDPLRDALKYEGDAMGHCVGGYCDEVRDGATRIFSLRDANGRPHATVEVQDVLQGISGDILNEMEPGIWDQIVADGGHQDSYKWLRNNRPDLLQKLDARPTQKIEQIKGIRNAAPASQYMPFVQDFVKSAQWSEVGDLKNTGLYRVTQGQKLPGFDKQIEPGYYSLEDFDRMATENEMPEEIKEIWFNKLRDQSRYGYKSGGAVTQNAPVYNPDAINALASELMEPVKLAGGGKIRRAAAAVRGATTPPPQLADELSVSDEEMMRIARDLGVDVDETIIPSDAPIQPTRRSGYGRSTIRGAGRKTIPGIYDDPRLIVERASAAVAPESEAMQQLFGVTREDLAKVAMEREPVVWLPPGAPARPRGTDYADLVMQPANTQRLVDILDEASESPLRAGMTGWYMLDPAYRRLVELVGEDEAKKLFVDMNTLTGVHSANAAVANELTRGTAMNWLNRENRLSDYVKYGAKAGMEGSPADMATIPGHLAHKTAHIIPALRYLETGELSKEAKTPAYITASNPPEIGTNVNFPVGDAHFVRAIGLSDVRPETKNPSARFASWSMPEAMQLNDWFTSDVARRSGLSGVSAQALLWGALSPTTGVKSKIGAPKLEILADLIMQTAQRLRISPEEARDMVLLGRAYAGKAAGGLVGYKQQISGEM